MTKWTMRWRSWIAPRPVLPGVFRRRDGGFLIRGRALDRRTGQQVEFKITLDQPGMTAVEAACVREQEIQRIRSGEPMVVSKKISFADFAVSLLEKKLALGEIRSAKTREKWGWMLEKHLIPRFGPLYMSELRRQDVDGYRTDLARQVRRDVISPRSANDRLSVLRTIVNEAVADLDLQRNPVHGVTLLDVTDHPSYTDEEPNALAIAEVPVFLDGMLKLYPQLYALTLLGFTTGLRASSLRPLRRRGPTPDVLWDEGVLLVRQSHTRGSEVMASTKQKTRYRISLPAELMDVLRWHVASLHEGPQQASDLLFPATTGGFRAASVLDRPFRTVAKHVGLKKRLTPRAMRRTFQDLTRVAEVESIITRAISGHSDEKMQAAYSTVSQDEIRTCIGKVIDFTGVRELRAALRAQEAPEGVHQGVRDLQNEKAG